MLIVVLSQTWQELGQTLKSWHQASQSMSMYGMSQPAIKDFAGRMKSLVSPMMVLGQGLFLSSLAWGFGCLIKSLREIEFNTRKAGADAPVAEKAAAAE